MRRKKATEPVSPEALAIKVEQLSRYVDSLDKAVSRLCGRIVPYDDEKEILRHLSEGEDFLKASNQPALKIYNLFLYIADKFNGIERDIGKVISQLDQISNDAWSRADFKEYLDQPKGPNRGRR